MKMKYKLNLLKNSSGFGLIEVIASLTISVVVITALVSLTVFTLRNSLQSTLLLEGSKVAKKELELVRAYRDSQDSWSDFLTALSPCDTANCHMNGSGSAVATGSNTINISGSDVIYSFRANDLSGGTIDSSDNTVRIFVDVSWVVGSQTKHSYLYTDLTNWRGN